MSTEVVPEVKTANEFMEDKSVAVEGATAEGEEMNEAGGEVDEVEVEATLNLADFYAKNGGDPRQLDLARCLLVSGIPSTMINDSYELFRDAMYSLLHGDFNVPNDALDAIIRAPRLFSDTEKPKSSITMTAEGMMMMQSSVAQENGLRAIISFKSRVHKHRVFAQKDNAEASLAVAQVDELPKDFVDEGDDFVMADEVVGDDEEEDDLPHDSEHAHDAKVNSDENGNAAKTEADAEGAEQSAGSPKNADKKKKFKKRDEDEDEPFEISWDGAPEFQWKLCQSPADSKQLVLENVTFGDLHNPWIYRVLARAKTVDVHMPWRVETNKENRGKIVLTFGEENAIMSQALRYLIFVRSPLGRRIKIYLPQTNQAVSRKSVFESRLGRVIKHRKTMYQLVIKNLPKDAVLDVNKAQPLFPDQAINEVEHKNDGNDKPCLIVTFASAEDAVAAHMLHSTVEIDNSKYEVDQEKLLTRWERREILLKEREKERKENGKASAKPMAIKRKSDGAGEPSPVKRTRVMAASRNTAPRGTSGRPVNVAIRGSYAPRGTRAPSTTASSNRPNTAPFRGVSGARPFVTRGGFSGPGRGGARTGAFPIPDRRDVYERRPAPFDRRTLDIDEKIRQERSAIAIQEQLLRQQQIIENLSAKVNARDTYVPPGYGELRDMPSSSFGRHSYGGSGSYDRGYGSAPTYHGPSAFNSGDFNSHRGGGSASSWAPLRR